MMGAQGSYGSGNPCGGSHKAEGPLSLTLLGNNPSPWFTGISEPQNVHHLEAGRSSSARFLVIFFGN
jgi:hypothetical protein